MNKPNQVTFSTFNLLNYLEPPNAYYDFENIYSFDEWQKKQNWIAEAIRSLDCDVIGFQEIFSPESLKKLMTELGYPHFAVVDNAHVEDDYLYTSPVVGIASRYPIENVQPVTPDSSLLAAFSLGDNFSFNRTPVHATIELPHLGSTDCYVVHFKSQRATEPKVETVEPSDSSAEQKPQSDTLIKLHQEQLGSWLSSVQRGLEAQMLHQYITNQRYLTDQPVVLMGDFNKPLFNDEFKGLLSYSLKRDETSQHWLSHFRLRDSWDLYHKLHEEDLLSQRKPTHYYGASGSVLDYILMSNEFDCQNSSSLMEISNYTVLDHHLINPTFERDQFSTDHAVVSVTAHIREA
ncbi:endonuclease/exonuclease/phosphatase family protein [Vibrio lentus]|uniref:endonuclease/exonuclease/phosphatase family protein n=1 Tax=Vibrio TaxID=662 RepID=UPI00030BA146|nr:MULTISPECIES: endonuclease/exonuclease/phosphatase family protein [Vibrio]OCH64738.1 endonuclease [Vibrio lentus]PMI57617.1 endonuclease [Vibrio lentus]